MASVVTFQIGLLMPGPVEKTAELVGNVGLGVVEVVAIRRPGQARSDEGADRLAQEIGDDMPEATKVRRPTPAGRPLPLG